MPQYPLEYPSAVKTAYERTSAGRVYRWTASALIGVYQALNWMPLQFPILARSSAYFSLWHVGGRAVFAAVQWLQHRYFEAQLAPGNPPEAQLSPDEVLERKVRMWRRYAVLQNKMISGTEGKRGFVFLQPNQYIKGSKEFSELEKATALNPLQFDHVDKSLRRFKEELPGLKRAGVKVHDLTAIFQQTKDTVYIDKCCHLNDRGNEIMANAIVSAIVDDR